MFKNENETFCHFWKEKVKITFRGVYYYGIFESFFESNIDKSNI